MVRPKPKKTKILSRTFFHSNTANADFQNPFLANSQIPLHRLCTKALKFQDRGPRKRRVGTIRPNGRNVDPILSTDFSRKEIQVISLISIAFSRQHPGPDFYCPDKIGFSRGVFLQLTCQIITIFPNH